MQKQYVMVGDLSFCCSIVLNEIFHNFKVLITFNKGRTHLDYRMTFKGNPNLHSTDSKLHTLCGPCFPFPFGCPGWGYDLANAHASTRPGEAPSN